MPTADREKDRKIRKEKRKDAVSLTDLVSDPDPDPKERYRGIFPNDRL